MKRQVEINDSQLQTTRSQFEQNLRLLGAREEELKQITGEVDKQSKELIKLAEELMETMGELEGETVLREAFELSRSGWKGAAGDAFSDLAGLREKLGDSRFSLAFSTFPDLDLLRIFSSKNRCRD